MNESLTARLDAILPQTQCTRCGYPACRPYAQAMASGEAPLNRCPPGGQIGIGRLADVLNTEPLPLDPAFGAQGPRLLARIEQEHCIGCTKCIVACPVDAIIGGPKWMHTVLPELCSGCELCVPPCPVDCIRIDPLDDTDDALAWQGADARAARSRFEGRARRRERHDEQDSMRDAEPAGNTQNGDARDRNEGGNEERKKAIIEAAMANARRRQAQRR